MARAGSWDLTGFAPTWFDGSANAGGFWDRDAVPIPAHAPPSGIPFVQQVSGADVFSDLFFKYDWLYRLPEYERAVSHELDFGYGQRVTFDTFEQRIQLGMETDVKDREATAVLEAFAEVDRLERNARLRRGAIVGGVTYLLIRFWLGL